MNPEYKYIKYKTKYSSFTNNTPIIIHICGASGSGKTTLGNKLQDKFGNKIIVKDIDDLRNEFIEEYYGDRKWTIIDKEEYQKYIDKFISKQKHNKPIIFVGLNNMPWWHEDHYYNMHSNYNFYIEIDDVVVVEQKCLRFLKNIQNDKEAMNDLINHNERFIKMVHKVFESECNKKKIIKMNKKWYRDYKKKGYVFMSREGIYREVLGVLGGNI